MKTLTESILKRPKNTIKYIDSNIRIEELYKIFDLDQKYGDKILPGLSSEHIIIESRSWNLELNDIHCQDLLDLGVELLEFIGRSNVILDGSAKGEIWKGIDIFFDGNLHLGYNSIENCNITHVRSKLHGNIGFHPNPGVKEFVLKNVNINTGGYLDFWFCWPELKNSHVTTLSIKAHTDGEGELMKIIKDQIKSQKPIDPQTELLPGSLEGVKTDIIHIENDSRSLRQKNQNIFFLKKPQQSFNIVSKFPEYTTPLIPMKNGWYKHVGAINNVYF